MVAQALVILCLSGAVVSVACAIYQAVKSWLDDRDQQVNQAMTEYRDKIVVHVSSLEQQIQALEEDNDALRQSLRAAMSRELDWITERKRLIARATMMAQELSLDDANKLTQVISR